MLLKNRTIDGKPVERSKRQYPYSYTAFCIYKNRYTCTDNVVYSDRLSNEPNYSPKLYEKHLGRGQYLSNKKPQDIENYLSDLFGYKVTLTGIEEECNCSNGYPYWILYYRKI